MAATLNVSSTRVTFSSQGGHYGYQLGHYTIVRVVIGPRSYGSESEPSSATTALLLTSLGHAAGFQFESTVSAAEKATLLANTIAPPITPPSTNTVSTDTAAKDLQRNGVVDALFVSRNAVLYTYKTYTTADLIYTFIYAAVGVLYGGFFFFVLFKFFKAFRLERADKRDDAKEKRRIQALKEKAELEAKVRAQLQNRGRGRGGMVARGRGAAGGASRGGGQQVPPPGSTKAAPALPQAALESDPVQKKAISKAATRVVERFHKQHHEMEKEMVAQGLRAQPSHELEMFLNATPLPPPSAAYDPFANSGTLNQKSAGVAGYLNTQQSNRSGRRPAENYNHPDGLDPAVAYSRSTFGAGSGSQVTWGGDQQRPNFASKTNDAAAVRFYDNPDTTYDHQPEIDNPKSASSDPLGLNDYSSGEGDTDVRQDQGDWAHFDNDDDLDQDLL